MIVIFTFAADGLISDEEHFDADAQAQHDEDDSELAPFMCETPPVLYSHPLDSDVASSGSVAAVENTRPSMGGAVSAKGVSKGREPYCQL
jgi:hypothetical protein